MSQETGEQAAKLRLLMDMAAGEPRRPVTVEAVRRGVARRRRAASAAAAAALILAGGTGVAVAAAAQRAEPGHRPAGPVPGGPSLPVTLPGSSGVPRYYIVRSVIPNNGSTANREETTVRATATGAVRARLRCPLTAPYAVSWPVAPAGNQDFFLVCQRAAGPQPSAKVLDSRIFLFHVTSSGRVTGVLPVRGGELGGRLVQSIAATPDGSEIAVIVYPGSHPPDLHRTPPDVIVIDTRTGARVIWRGAPPVSGRTVYWPQDISLTADGQRLVFLTRPQCFQAGCTVSGGQQMRVVLHPASGGGQLNSAGVLVRLNSVLPLSSATVMDAVISPDGSALTVVVMGTLPGKPDSVSVVQIPVSGHQRLRFVYRLPRGDSYGFFSADPPGSHFLLGTSTLNGPLAGRIGNGKLIPLRPDPVVVQAMVW
ncbi:MAG TPA: hypothetical protein VGQ05_04195 [Streptosporangiaceae bacterium]|nr:hypothetical protein [Streptosporangiaceae bacterium]